jgi:pullulanase/glycogen debranching enzyme
MHDGFTLNDLVPYNQKHNEVNGEDNRDGGDASLTSVAFIDSLFERWIADAPARPRVE